MTKYRTTYDEISHNTLNNLKQHMTNITRMFLENRHHMSKKYVSCQTQQTPYKGEIENYTANASEENSATRINKFETI